MPTLIQLANGDSIVVEEELQAVDAYLHGKGGQFRRIDKGDPAQVVVYAQNVAFIPEHQEPEGPGVAYG